MQEFPLCPRLSGKYRHPAFIRCVREGKFDEAYSTIIQDNLFRLSAAEFVLKKNSARRPARSEKEYRQLPLGGSKDL